MSHYKPYPAYKDSGVEWLGRVPEHWAVSPIGYEIDLITGYAFPSEKFNFERGVPLVRGDNVTEGALRWGDKARFWPEMAPELGKFLLAERDVLIGMDGSKVGKNYAMVTSADLPLLLVQRVARLRSRGNIYPDYVFRLIGSPLFRTWVDLVRTDPAIPHISPKDINSFVIAVPPSSEQSAILVHLDHETTRIDALIEKKTRFIELLREKRQALITHAVTKGLDPNVKMKDSGVEWLGEVPEHWEALPLRRVVTAVKTGGTPSEEQPAPDADGLAWYTPGDFGSSLVLTSSEKRVSALAVSTGEAKVYPAGSVLVVSIGATLGKVGYIVDPASANQQINAVIPSSRVNGYFLAYSLSVKTEAMWFLANAATIGIMNQEKTKEIWLAVPSPSEQKAITEYLYKGTGRLDSLIGKTEHSITLLKERRSVLITAAVTGQIDLRETV